MLSRLILFCCLIFSFEAFGQDDQTSLGLEEAQMAFAESDYFKSLAILHKLSPAEPGQELQKYLLQIESYLELADLQLAQEVVDQTTNFLNYSYADYDEKLRYSFEILKGRISTFQRKFELADSILTSVLLNTESEEQQVKARIGLAALSLEMQKDQEAVDSLHQILNDLNNQDIPLEVLKAKQIQAMAFGYLGQLDTAIYIYNQTLILCDQYLPERHYYKAISLHQISTQYQRKGASEKGIPFSLAALDIFDHRFEGSHPNYGVIYNNTGVMYVRKGDLIRSLVYFEKALTFKESLADPDFRSIANSHLNIGSISFNLNQHQKASYHLMQALRLRKESGEENTMGLALVYQLLGEAAGGAGDYDLAHNYLDTCFQIRTAKAEPGDASIGRVYLKKTGVYLKQNQLNKALDFAERTVLFFEKHPSENQSDLAGAWSNLAQVYKLNGQEIEAINYFRESKKILGVYQNSDGVFLASDRIFLMELLLSEAQAQEQLADKTKNNWDWEKAVKMYADAYHLLSWIRMDMSSERGRTAMNNLHYPIFEGLIRMYFNKWEETGVERFLVRSFEWSEKSKASLLLDALKASQATNYNDVPEALIKQEQQLRDDLARLEKESFFDSNNNDLKDQLFEAKETYAELLKNFQSNYPKYYTARFRDQVTSLEALQLKLEDDEMLIAYFSGTTEVFTFLIRQNAISAKRMQDISSWSDAIKNLRLGIYGYAALDNPSSSEYSDFAKLYADNAHDLYLKIFAPLGALPKKLLIIPDGVLWYLPFETLLSNSVENGMNFRSHPYLLNDFSISYAISSTWWLEQQGGTAKSTKLLSIAPSFSDLSFNETEAEKVAKIGKGELVSGDQSTIAWFNEYYSNYSSIHFSTHARLNDLNSDFCYLEFAGNPKELFVRDLYNYALPLDMVVLSACHSGSGKLERGEGVISLARAFAYAGAKSIVTTSWQVDDYSGMELMESFYEELKSGKDKRTSLNNAKLQYLQNQRENRLASPYYWATYSLIGNADSLNFSSINYSWLFLLGLILGLIRLWVLFRQKSKNANE